MHAITSARPHPLFGARRINYRMQQRGEELVNYSLTDEPRKNPPQL